MNLLQALILGLLQGVTEFFPISSSGHLVLAESLFGFQPTELFAFNVIIHFATLLAVVLYFYRDLKSLTLGVIKTKKSSLQLLRALILATIPAVAAGLLAADVFESIHDPKLVAVFMLLTGLFFTIAERFKNHQRFSLNPQGVLYPVIVGLSQVLAMFPGVSRSGTTLATSMLLGESRQNSARFSFLIAIPAILGALVYMLLFKSQSFAGIPYTSLITGFLSAFISGYISIKFLMYLYEKHSLKPFAIYLLILGALLLLLLYPDSSVLCDCAGP